MEVTSETVIQIHDDNGQRSGTIAITPSESISGEPETIIRIEDVASAQPRSPSKELFTNKNSMKKLCVPIHKAALRADWDEVKSIIEQDNRILTSSITQGGRTVLHVAVGSKNVNFVERIVEILGEEDLALPDANGNTALCHVAATAPVEMAEIILKKNLSLASIRGGENVTPLYMAATCKRPEMARYLYTITKDRLDERDRPGIFFSCINNGIYDLALELLKDDLSLFSARDDNDKTALHHLAETPSAFVDSAASQWWTKIAESCFDVIFQKPKKQTTALELVRHLWDEVLNLDHDEVMKQISTPSNLLFDATRLGNFEFLQVLVSSYPDLVWECNSQGWTIIHTAVKYRHANIFSLIYNIGANNGVIATYEDDESNNILHLAALLPPSDRLNTVSGAALQMHKELLWFEEVKKFVTPFYESKENNNGMNPRKLFTSEHMPLLKEGEKWMKDTSHSGLIVSTILTTVVFTAAFSVPGGNSNSGSPNDIKYTAFLIFMLSDGFAMISSVVASLMFLSILTSRYSEDDFLKSLPLKLMIGLTSLFLSMTTTMVAFSSTIAIECHTGLIWVAYLIILLSLVPIALFANSQFPLWFDNFSSICWPRIMFQPTRGMSSWLEKSNVEK